MQKEATVGLLKRWEDRVREREIVLQQNLDRFVDACRSHPEVRSAFVFGSVARGSIGPMSDLDLLVVRQTTLPYHDRGDDLRRAAHFSVDADIIVVTPLEYAEVFPKTSFGATLLAECRSIYAA